MLFLWLLKTAIQLVLLDNFAQLASGYGAYLHIPFCRRRCYYCDFSIEVIGDRSSTQERESLRYTSLLVKDIEQSVSCDATYPPLETIYFGGGTPSLLPVDCVSTILKTLDKRIGIASDAEITFEMDPATFDASKARQLREAGINRVSLGVQSFDDEILKRCGRSHTSREALKAVEDCIKAGLENISVDLISGLPHLSREVFSSSLLQAASCGAKHVSVYDLQVEDGTAFGRWYTPGVFPLPSEDSGALMYRDAVEVLTGAGFEHYEVSNYALPGYQSKHNLKYWACAPVWGFGLAAASYVNGEREVRPSDMKAYRTFVDDTNRLPVVLKTSVAPPDVFEYLMLALRTKQGLNLVMLQSLFGLAIFEAVTNASSPFIELQLMRRSDDDSRLSLSDPNGFLVSNDIISTLFSKLS